MREHLHDPTSSVGVAGSGSTPLLPGAAFRRRLPGFRGAAVLAVASFALGFSPYAPSSEVSAALGSPKQLGQMGLFGDLPAPSKRPAEGETGEEGRLGKAARMEAPGGNSQVFPDPAPSAVPNDDMAGLESLANWATHVIPPPQAWRQPGKQRRPRRQWRRALPRPAPRIWTSWKRAARNSWVQAMELEQRAHQREQAGAGEGRTRRERRRRRLRRRLRHRHKRQECPAVPPVALIKWRLRCARSPHT